MSVSVAAEHWSAPVAAECWEKFGSPLEQIVTGVLNLHSSFDVRVVDAAEEYPERSELADPPTKEEVMEALGKLKGGKAGGKSGILPEMVRGCGGEIVDYIMDMFHTVWMEQTVPQEWRDALLVPLPKKGDLTQCDNWRGVSLLNVVAKVFSKVIQVRLQRVAEEMLPDSQCGFRAGRGCADMIFCARQLVEKAKKYRHHGDKQGALAAWEELEQTGLGRVERTETSKGVGTVSS